MSEENKTVELEDKELKQVTGGVGGDGDTTSTININIRDMQGRTFHYTVSPEITIYDLKALYTEGEKHVKYVRLVYKGQTLDNSRTIASYNIPNEAQIHVTWTS